MADSVVRLLVDARNALTGLRQTNKESEKLKRAFTALSSEAKKVKGAVEANNAGFVKLSQVQGVFSAKVRNTEAAIKAQIRALRDVQSRVELGGSIYQKAGQKIAAYETRLRSASQAKEQASRRSRRLGGALTALGGVAGKAALVFAAFKAAQVGISRAESERRLKLLGERFGEVSQLQALAAQNADKFNLSQTESNQALANVFARLRPLGVSLADINSTFAGFRTAAILGGATAQEASASFTQLSQALGSGALRGDEFRSVAEQAPLVLQAISDETGIAAGELKDYAKEGLLTSDIVIKALKRIETEGADQLAEALGGPAAAIKEFQNAAEDVGVALTEAVVPGMAEGFRDLAQIIRDLEGPIKFVGGLLGGLLDMIQGVTGRLSRGFEGARIDKLASDEAIRRTGKNAGPEYQRALAEEKLIIGARFAREGQMGNLPASAANIPGSRQPLGTSPITRLPKSISSRGLTDEEKAARELKKLEKERKRLAKERNDEDLKRRQSFQDELDKLGDENALMRAKLDGTYEEERVKQRIAALEEKFADFDTSSLERLVLEGEELRRQDNERLEAAQRQKQAAEKIASVYRQIGQTIETGIVSGIQAAVFQTQTLAEVASNTLNNLANQLLKMGVNMLLGSLGGNNPASIFTKLFGDGLAEGGRAQAGRSYIVGERGPELFTPGGTGTVTPNHALMGGGSIVVNVDASGSAVEGEGPQAKQLGNVIGVAVRQELLKQKRPGGLLA